MRSAAWGVPPTLDTGDRGAGANTRVQLVSSLLRLRGSTCSDGDATVGIQLRVNPTEKGACGGLSSSERVN